MGAFCRLSIVQCQVAGVTAETTEQAEGPHAMGWQAASAHLTRRERPPCLVLLRLRSHRGLRRRMYSAVLSSWLRQSRRTRGSEIFCSRIPSGAPWLRARLGWLPGSSAFPHLWMLLRLVGNLRALAVLVLLSAFRFRVARHLCLFGCRDWYR